MTEKFVASNGVIVDQHGYILTVDFTSRGQDHEARKEFYQHISDSELGRWRDPLNKSCVIYPMGNLVGGLRTVQVVNEDHGFCGQVNEGDPENMEIRVSAARYFAAHPEPKPWHDAKTGEVWVLEGGGIAEPWAHTVQRDGMAEVHINLTAARKIWPVSDV